MKSILLSLIVLLICQYSLEAKEVQKVVIPANPFIRCMMQDGKNIYCGTYGVVKTNNWGQSIEKLSTLYANDGQVVDMEDKNYIVTNIFKSQAGSIVASVKDKYIIYSHNDGIDWYETNLKTQGLQHFYEYGDTLYMTNDGELYLSQDNGENWEIYLSRQYVDKDKTRDCHICKDTLYLISKEGEQLTECIIRFIDLKTNKTSVFNTDMDIDYLYSYNDELYAYNYLALYKKTKENKHNKFVKTIDISHKIKELFNNTEESIFPITFMSHKNILVMGFSTNASVPVPHIEYAISYDNGETWILVNWNGIQYSNDDMIVVDGDIYITMGDIYKYVAANNKFEALGVKSYRIYTPNKYREFNNYNVYQDEQEYWFSDSSGKWTPIENSRSLDYTLNGNMYFYDVEHKILYCNTKSGIETVEKDIYGFNLQLESGNYHLIEYYKSGEKYQSICQNGNIIWSIDSLDYPSNQFYINEHGKYIYTKIDSNKHYVFSIGNLQDDIIDEILIGDFLRPNKLTNLSLSGDNISFRSSWGQIYTSNNLTQSIDSTLSASIIENHSTVLAINDMFYAGTTIGLLFSEDGLIWEQFFEYEEEYNVSAFEYSPYNQLYIYSDKGIFISDVDVSVENSFDKDVPKISIFPNPTSDFITVDSDYKVSITRVWDVNGVKYDIYSEGNQLDISNLPDSQYILELHIHGKTYYKFFNIVR